MVVPDMKNNLVAIYESLTIQKPLALDGHIQAQQHDDFIRLWKISCERECILANCRYYANKNLKDGRLLLPLNKCAAKESLGDGRLQGRSEALADSIGELVWMLITNFGILPILEIATPIGPQDKIKLDALAQPWVSLYFPTASVYFVVGKRGSFESDATTSADSLLGWVDELYIADYDTPSGNKSVSLPDDWKAYQITETKVALPNFFHYPKEYLNSHKGEIVAGYVGQGVHWRLAVINGLAHGGEDDAIVKLYGTSGQGTYSDAVRRNVEAFRPQLIARKVDPSALVDCQEHQQARQQHGIAVGCVAGTYVITLAYGLVTGGSEATNHREYDHASSFLTCLFSVPESAMKKLSFSLQQRQADTYSAEAAFEQFWARIVAKLWDSIDVLRLQISRQMMMQANDELRVEREELRRKTVLLDALTKPVEALSRQLNRAVAEMTKIQGIYKWSIRGAYERAPLVASVFKDNSSTLLNERFVGQLNHNGCYTTLADARLALRGVIYTWLGHDLSDTTGVDISFTSLFETLTSDRPDRDVNHLLASVIKPFRSPSIDQWELDDFNSALRRIKRQLHTNLKSFNNSEVLVMDLLFALPMLTEDGSFDLTVEYEPMLLKAGRNPLPRVIDFVEFIASLTMTLAPGAWNKNGGVVLRRNECTTTIELETRDSGSEDRSPPSKLLALLSDQWKAELPAHLDSSLGNLAEPIVGMMRLCLSDYSPKLRPTWNKSMQKITFTWELRPAELTIEVDLQAKKIIIGE